jgi:putative glutamine amidotransferase
MKKAPLILITPCTQMQGAEFDDVSLSLSQCYTQAIEAAGGIPWVMPVSPAKDLIRECVRRCDGVMLTGGDDLQPQLYAAELSPKLTSTVKQTDPHRDLMEMEIIRAVFEHRRPLLAICRGHQLLNVAFGGTLLVDIRTQVPKALNHRQPDQKDELVHEIDIAPGTLLAKITGKEHIGVNSAHHQGIDRVAAPFQVNAISTDGVIEGLELNPKAGGLLPYLLSVQYHPERLFGKHREHAAVFVSFVKVCVSGGKP